MRFLPTRVHGMLDYLVGALLIAVPWLLGFARGGSETWIPVLLGAGAIVYSLFTDYEFGAVRRIPMGTHLALDAGSGLLLAAAPWLLGFSGRVKAPHVALGIMEVVTALSTKTEPEG